MITDPSILRLMGAVIMGFASVSAVMVVWTFSRGQLVPALWFAFFSGTSAFNAIALFTEALSKPDKKITDE